MPNVCMIEPGASRTTAMFIREVPGPIFREGTFLMMLKYQIYLIYFASLFRYSFKVYSQARDFIDIESCWFVQERGALLPEELSHHQ
jgi:hypothetical protein